MLVGKVTKYKSQLGSDLLTEFTDLRTSFASVRGGQVQEKGKAREQVRLTRRPLEIQLTDNLLTLAKQFVGQPERAAEFFDQSLLEDPVQAKPPRP